MPNKSKLQILTILLISITTTILLNIAAMIFVSHLFDGKLNTLVKFTAILPGTLIGAFISGYLMESSGWMWGIFITLIAMLLASIFHPDRVPTTILIYILQIIPAGIVGEFGSRYRKSKLHLKSGAET